MKKNVLFVLLAALTSLNVLTMQAFRLLYNRLSKMFGSLFFVCCELGNFEK